MAYSPQSALRRFLRRIAARFARDPGEGVAHLSGLVFVGLIVGMMVYLLFGGGPKSPAPPAAPELVAIGGPFRLVGPDGQEMTERSFPRRWLLVFFGYTFCPDICPTTLADIANAMDRLGPLADRVQPLFITIDPKRDSPAVLKDYTAHFDKRIIGLSGDAGAIAAALRAYKVYAAERPSEDGTSPALFDHTGTIYLMKPSGAFATVFNAGLPGAALAKGIRAAIEDDPGA